MLVYAVEGPVLPGAIAARAFGPSSARPPRKLVTLPPTEPPAIYPLSTPC